eukprot:GHVP01068760.1.p1 GENE.GHVP01068760.1~~GHVP01068760.1.p1  ORF type:complete len:212 (+),score=52.15 GHVP01068760.1:37-636(+)
MTDKPTSIYSFTATKSDGTPFPLSTLKGHPLLVVNTASKCGLAPQNNDLKALDEKLYDKGLRILCFPCNQFAGQEPETDACVLQNLSALDDKLLIFKKIDVNGDNADPLYKYMKNEKKGIFGTTRIKWNYTKFVVDKEGKVIKRISPTTNPSKLADLLTDLCEGKENSGADLVEEVVPDFEEAVTKLEESGQVEHLDEK